MMQTPAHKSTEGQVVQFSGGPLGGDLKLGTLRPGEPDVVDRFIPDPFIIGETGNQTPAFYMAKIADTLEKIEECMRDMLGKMR